MIRVVLPAHLRTPARVGREVTLDVEGSATQGSVVDALEARYPEKVGVRIGYDHALSHRMEAGADFFLMPSHFEPCGLNQMYSLRYGTIPIVRRTGGLDDSVVDVSDDPQLANGIKFTEPSSRALAKAIRKALVLYADPQLIALYRRNGMKRDFSWETTREAYLEVFRRARGGV